MLGAPRLRAIDFRIRKDNQALRSELVTFCSRQTLLLAQAVLSHFCHPGASAGTVLQQARSVARSEGPMHFAYTTRQATFASNFSPFTLVDFVACIHPRRLYPA